MQEFDNYRAAYNRFCYTKREQEIINGIKTEISTKEFFKLLDKSHRLMDVWTHGELFTSFEIDGKTARRCEPFGRFWCGDQLI